MTSSGPKNLASRSAAMAPITGFTERTVVSFPVDNDSAELFDLVAWIVYGAEIIFTETLNNEDLYIASGHIMSINI